MSYIQTVYKILVFIIICGCGNTDDPNRLGSRPKLNYFDLKGFIDSETERLAQQVSFSKTVFVNGEKETKKVENVNLKNELKPFSDSDINKPSWVGKYAVDSTFNQKKELVSLRYQAKDKKLKTKNLVVDFYKNVVSKIFIKNATNSSVANTYQTLTYQPKTGHGVQDIHAGNVYTWYCSDIHIVGYLSSAWLFNNK